MQVNVVRVCFFIGAIFCLYQSVDASSIKWKRQIAGPVLFPTATGNQIPQNTRPRPSPAPSTATRRTTTATSRPRPSPSSTPMAGTTTTTASPQYTSCVSNCRTTPEYNPVCGSNGITYDSAARLSCARRCGTAVEVAFIGRCQGL